MKIDKNDPFITVLEYIINHRDDDLSEYTITKLEEEVENNNKFCNLEVQIKGKFSDDNKVENKEKGNDIMSNEKSMDIFEALKYVKDNKDEYLVQKHNDRFTLHFDGKKHYTKFKTDSGKIVEGKVELDNAMNCSEWVKVEKLYTFVFNGFLEDKLVYTCTDELQSQKQADQLAERIQFELLAKFSLKPTACRIHYNPNINVKYYLLHDLELEPITIIKA